MRIGMRLFLVAAAMIGMGTAATAQTPTVKVPQCLMPYSTTKVYLPCTGTVPVDSATGNALSWRDLFASIPSSTATSTVVDANTASTKAQPVQNADGTKIATDASVLSVKTTLGSPFQVGGTIGNTTFGATQSGTWNVGVTGSVPVTGTFWQATQPVSGTITANLGTLNGVATATNQTANTTAITNVQSAPGTSAATATGVQGVTGGLPIDTVVKGTAVDYGALVGTTAVTLAPLNTARRGWAIQVQAGSGVSCYVNGMTTATADYHSLQVAGGGYYQSPDNHVGTGALSVICTAASTPVYFRTW